MKEYICHPRPKSSEGAGIHKMVEHFQMLYRSAVLVFQTHPRMTNAERSATRYEIMEIKL